MEKIYKIILIIVVILLLIRLSYVIGFEFGVQYTCDYFLEQKGLLCY